MPAIPVEIIRTDTPAPQPPPEHYSGYLCKFRTEGGNDNPPDEPAVTPSQWKGDKFGTFVWFTEDLQRLAWELTQYTNPLMTTKNWASVWAGDTAFTNGNGWDSAKEPDDQRRDYVNDRYRGYDEPKVMDAIVCSGGLYRLQDRSDGHLWAIPGWSGINVRKVLRVQPDGSTRWVYEQPLPSAQEIIAKRWYFRAMINPREGRQPYDFAQGQGHANGVIVPYFLIEEVPYTKSYFTWYEGSELPRYMQVKL